MSKATSFLPQSSPPISDFITSSLIIDTAKIEPQNNCLLFLAQKQHTTVQRNEARVRRLGKVDTIVLGRIEFHAHNLRYDSFGFHLKQEWMIMEGRLRRSPTLKSIILWELGGSLGSYYRGPNLCVEVVSGDGCQKMKGMMERD
ncbi:hypothetical protein C5167_024632 [Papaver somniferum]|uniref:Uncharacterized protein n=1 Tax=Papaver somniferum TaxID=3469 RepID=A0A4Y7JT82_PAPSO|nr:hypothetical protein C5167_024632 [Papaver somniferum]